MTLEIALLVIAVLIGLIILWIVYYLFYKKKKVIQRIKELSTEEKARRVDELAETVGYAYHPVKDIFYARNDSWQGDYGYGHLYDAMATAFHIVIDCEPVYFEFDNKTWLVELWKGQYGITTGGEVGLYAAKTLVREEDRKKVIFEKVKDEDMLFVECRIFQGMELLLSMEKKTWWLAAFRIGRCVSPRDLIMQVRITFQNKGMQLAFCEALEKLGYRRKQNIWLQDKRVTIHYEVPYSEQPISEKSIRVRFATLRNKLLYWLYQKITRPFSKTTEQILYFYEMTPSALRHFYQKTVTEKRRQKGREEMQYGVSKKNG